MSYRTLSYKTVYFKVPVPTILCIPNPSPFPDIGLYFIKSSLWKEMDMEHPKYRIASTASLSNVRYLCVFVTSVHNNN